MDTEANMAESFKWKLSDISTHPDLQIRVKTDPETVDRYAQLYSDGQYLPPIHIIEATDGTLYLIDGHHRYAAAKKAGLEEIAAVLDGENTPLHEMVVAAIQANSKNGLALTAKDRQRAAELLIINKPGLSLRQIAQEVGISKSSVENYIKKLIEKKSIVKCEFCAEYTPYQDHEAREWHPFRGKYVCPTCYPNRFLLDLQRSVAFHARNLHKCAKCGNVPDVAILENHEVYVECPQCGTKTDPRKTAYGAVEVWNSTNPQEQDETPIVIYPEGHEPQEDAAPEVETAPTVETQTETPPAQEEKTELEKKMEYQERFLEKCAKCGNAPKIVSFPDGRFGAECAKCRARLPFKCNLIEDVVQEWNAIVQPAKPQEEDAVPAVENEITLACCPFCGSPAEFIEKNYGGESEWSVSCQNSDCSCFPETDTYDTMEEAAEIWNTRHISSRHTTEIIQKALAAGVSLFDGNIRLQLKTESGETFLEVEEMKTTGISSIHSYPSPIHQ